MDSEGPYAAVLKEFCVARKLPDPTYDFTRLFSGYMASVNYSLGLATVNTKYASKEPARESVAKKALDDLRVDTTFISPKRDIGKSSQ